MFEWRSAARKRAAFFASQQAVIAHHGLRVGVKALFVRHIDQADISRHGRRAVIAAFAIAISRKILIRHIWIKAGFINLYRRIVHAGAFAVRNKKLVSDDRDGRSILSCRDKSEQFRMRLSCRIWREADDRDGICVSVCNVQSLFVVAQRKSLGARANLFRFSKADIDRLDHAISNGVDDGDRVRI